MASKCNLRAETYKPTHYRQVARSRSAANEALLQKAKDDLADTIVYAPMSGRLGIDDVSVGTLSTAGSTPLATIGIVDPVYVQFAVSEQEYLRLNRGYEEAQRRGDAQPDYKARRYAFGSDASHRKGYGLFVHLRRKNF